MFFCLFKKKVIFFCFSIFIYISLSQFRGPSTKEKKKELKDRIAKCPNLNCMYRNNYKSPDNGWGMYS